MEKKQLIEAGQIVGVHGVRGEVKIACWLDSPEFLQSFQTLYIAGSPVRVRALRPHKSAVLCALEGVETPEAATALKNAVVCIDRADAHLPEGSYFLCDLLGAQAVTETGDVLGTLEEIWERPAHDIYVVRGEREYLIPAIPEFVLQTDAEQGRITVRLLEGM